MIYDVEKQVNTRRSDNYIQETSYQWHIIILMLRLKSTKISIALLALWINSMDLFLFRGNSVIPVIFHIRT